MAVASSRGYDLRSRSAPVSSFGVMMAEQVRKSTPAASSRTHAIHSGEAWYVPMRILETVALTPHSTPPHRVIAMPIIRSFGVRSNVFPPLRLLPLHCSLIAHRTRRMCLAVAAAHRLSAGALRKSRILFTYGPTTVFGMEKISCNDLPYRIFRLIRHLRARVPRNRPAVR